MSHFPTFDEPSQPKGVQPSERESTTVANLPPRDVSVNRTKAASYVAIARPDHWSKNVFMLPGLVLALFVHPEMATITTLSQTVIGVLATCFIASSNYVLNEILDCSTDRAHPRKQFRPIPSGQVDLRVAYAEWLILAFVGLTIAHFLNHHFLVAAGVLVIMGLVYNVPPVRLKDYPYLDVLVESINNPLRLSLGWFSVSDQELPPPSLLISTWMMGAFFMAAKRLAEYREIATVCDAGAYRASFRHYSPNRLIVSMLFYATAGALFLGVFMVRFHVELVLTAPLIAGFFAWYTHLSLNHISPAQNPETLHREYWLVAYLVLCAVLSAALLFVRIQFLHEWLDIALPGTPHLWNLAP